MCCIRHGRHRSRLRALNGVLGVELQPEELLLEAVEAPWRGESNESRGLDGRGKCSTAGEEEGTAEGGREEGTGAR